MANHLLGENVVGDLAVNRSKGAEAVERAVLPGRVEIAAGADTAARVLQSERIRLPLVVSLHNLERVQILHSVLIAAVNLSARTHGPRVRVAKFGIEGRVAAVLPHLLVKGHVVRAPVAILIQVCRLIVPDVQARSLLSDDKRVGHKRLAGHKELVVDARPLIIVPAVVIAGKDSMPLRSSRGVVRNLNTNPVRNSLRGQILVQRGVKDLVGRFCDHELVAVNEPIVSRHGQAGERRELNLAVGKIVCLVHAQHCVQGRPRDMASQQLLSVGRRLDQHRAVLALQAAASLVRHEHGVLGVDGVTTAIDVKADKRRPVSGGGVVSNLELEHVGQQLRASQLLCGGSSAVVARNDAVKLLQHRADASPVGVRGGAALDVLLHPGELAVDERGHFGSDRSDRARVGKVEHARKNEMLVDVALQVACRKVLETVGQLHE